MNRRLFIELSGAALAAEAWGTLLVPRASAQEATRAPEAGAVVETTAGRVRGLVIDKVNAFKGVPYGASTAGAARFMPPAMPKAWTGVRDATTLGERSPQAGQDVMYPSSFPRWSAGNLRARTAFG